METALAVAGTVVAATVGGRWLLSHWIDQAHSPEPVLWLESQVRRAERYRQLEVPALVDEVYEQTYRGIAVRRRLPQWPYVAWPDEPGKSPSGKRLPFLARPAMKGRMWWEWLMAFAMGGYFLAIGMFTLGGTWSRSDEFGSLFMLVVIVAMVFLVWRAFAHRKRERTALLEMYDAGEITMTCPECADGDHDRCQDTMHPQRPYRGCTCQHA